MKKDRIKKDLKIFLFFSKTRPFQTEILSILSYDLSRLFTITWNININIPFKCTNDIEKKEKIVISLHRFSRFEKIAYAKLKIIATIFPSDFILEKIPQNKTINDVLMRRGNVG